MNSFDFFSGRPHSICSIFHAIFDRFPRNEKKDVSFSYRIIRKHYIPACLYAWVLSYALLWCHQLQRIEACVRLRLLHAAHAHSLVGRFWETLFGCFINNKFKLTLHVLAAVFRYRMYVVLPKALKWSLSEPNQWYRQQYVKCSSTYSWIYLQSLANLPCRHLPCRADHFYRETCVLLAVFPSDFSMYSAVFGHFVPKIPIL